MPRRAAIDWDGVDLVIFDVDGTLYHQLRLRARMAAALIGEMARSASWRVPRAVHAYRQCREALAGGAFAQAQYSAAAARCGLPEGELRRIAEDWIERRPLDHLRACRVAGIDRLFDGLARSGRTVAILSDYPAQAKLAALGLAADLVVWAGDVGRLKPDPAGVRHILSVSGTAPARALVIGDRADRDGEAARRAGVRALLRGGRGDFRRFDDPLFAPVLAPAHAR